MRLPSLDWKRGSLRIYLVASALWLVLGLIDSGKAWENTVHVGCSDKRVVDKEECLKRKLEYEKTLPKQLEEANCHNDPDKKPRRRFLCAALEHGGFSNPMDVPLWDNIYNYFSYFFRKSFWPWLLLTGTGIMVFLIVKWITIPIIEWIIKGFKKDDLEK